MLFCMMPVTSLLNARRLRAFCSHSRAIAKLAPYCIKHIATMYKQLINKISCSACVHGFWIVQANHAEAMRQGHSAD